MDNEQQITGVYIEEDGTIKVVLNMVATLKHKDKKRKTGLYDREDITLRNTWRYARDIHATLEFKLKVENDDNNNRLEIRP